ncbi:Flp pilus assembly protein CpaB [Rhizohabitans arisaemae]|uniref:Flp pilus assembly protein CpaB n=1 Tax=Rhizohabitans arisaemae TaxID=2720610 RepID=UPI0024B0AEFE|nr:Flp pilus assembly protein CpaB [Rhizohabitans arisaemae]
MRALRRAFARRRRFVAALLAAAATASVILALRPESAEPVPVLVASRDLRGGALSDGDLVLVGYPPQAVPDGALRSAASVHGRVLSGPMRRGEPLTDARLLGPGMLTGSGSGLVAAPVRIADADAAHLVTSGDRIDVLAVSPESDTASGVARDVPVLAVPAPARPGGGDGALVVLAVTSDQAARLAHAQTRARLSLTVHRRE